MRLSYHTYSFAQGIRKIKTKTALVLSAVGLLAGSGGLALAVMSTTSAVAPVAIYNNIPSPQPGNVPSVSFEATGTSEFGGQVSFAGTARSNPTVAVLMSSWGCETGHWTTDDCTTTPGTTFPVPITLNIYSVGVGNAPGVLVTTATQTFNIPYRPSADHTNCGTTGEWYNGTTCYNGLATPISFNLSGTLPDQAIVSVAYNTSDYGYNPIGRESACSATPAGCGYDSLNVGTANALTVGTQPVSDGAYQKTQYDSCTNGAVNPFGLDQPCWSGYQPAFEVEASSSTVTVTIDKFVDGVQSTALSTNSASFPMVSSWSAANIGSGSGSYSLSSSGFNNVNPYMATTSDMSLGANYATNEVTSGPVVAATCSPGGAPYALVGYSIGDTLSAAQAAPVTITSPSFTDLQRDQFVIVWNKSCTKPTTTDQCKNNGWKSYGIFKNQGDCVSFVATNGKNQPSGH